MTITILQRIKAGDINPLPNGVSEGCRTLLMRLLEVDPGKRYKVEDLCQVHTHAHKCLDYGMAVAPSCRMFASCIFAHKSSHVCFP